MKLALEKGKSRTLRLRRSLQAMTRRSGFWYGRGRSSTALVTLKMAVLAPTPKAMVSAAVSAKTGLFRKVRPAKARSRNGIFPPHSPAVVAPRILPLSSSPGTEILRNRPLSTMRFLTVLRGWPRRITMPLVLHEHSLVFVRPTSSLKEKHRHETSHSNFPANSLCRAIRFRARLGQSYARKISAPPRVGHHQTRWPLGRNLRRLSRIEEQDAGSADHPRNFWLDGLGARFGRPDCGGGLHCSCTRSSFRHGPERRPQQRFCRGQNDGSGKPPESRPSNRGFERRRGLRAENPCLERQALCWRLLLGWRPDLQKPPTKSLPFEAGI